MPWQEKDCGEATPPHHEILAKQHGREQSTGSKHIHRIGERWSARVFLRRWERSSRLTDKLPPATKPSSPRPIRCISARSFVGWGDLARINLNLGTALYAVVKWDWNTQRMSS